MEERGSEERKGGAEAIPHCTLAVQVLFSKVASALCTVMHSQLMTN